MISEIEIEPYPELDREFAGIEASRKEHRHAIAVGSFCQRPDSRGHQRLSAPRHLADERGTRRRRSSRPPRATPPGRAESCAMPTENGRGLDEQGCFTPSWRDCAARTIVKRCQGVHRTRPASFRLVTMSCCRRSAFSATSSTRRRTRSAASPKTNRRSRSWVECYTVRADDICSQDG